MTNKEKIDSMLKFFHGRRTLESLLLEMAEWKDQQFEDTKDEIKVDVKKELAWKIHEKIANGVTLVELDHYVCGICDF